MSKRFVFIESISPPPLGKANLHAAGSFFKIRPRPDSVASRLYDAAGTDAPMLEMDGGPAAYEI